MRVPIMATVTRSRADGRVDTEQPTDSATRWPRDGRESSVMTAESTGESVPLVAALDFESYYRDDYHQLVGLALVLTGSRAMAEDVCQDALTEAHRRWDTISRYDDPGAWVRRVMVNKSRSRFRRLTSETKAITKLGTRRLETVEPTERSLEVWDHVRALPKRQAQTVALFYWEDRSIAQISSILSCSEETVKTHLKRGRAALANKLGPTDVGGDDDD